MQFRKISRVKYFCGRREEEGVEGVFDTGERVKMNDLREKQLTAWRVVERRRRRKERF